MTRPTYPEARRDEVVDEIFGHRVADPYRWLEDADSPQTQAWLAAQDELTSSCLGALPGRDRLRARVTQLLGAGLVTAPVWRGERAFFLRRTAEQEHAVLLVREPDGSERVLIDPTALDPAGTTTLDAWQPDKEGRRLAYQLSSGGDEESLLRVLDVATGDIVDGPIDRTRYSPVAWVPGGAAFYYVRRLPPGDVPAGEEQFHRRVYRRELGGDDELVWGQGLDKTNYYGASVSRDGRWLVVSASAGTAPRNDVWLADLDGDGRLRPVQEAVDAQTSLHVGRDGRLYVLTNRAAPRGRLCVTTPETPGYDAWRELVPEDPEAVLEDFALLEPDILLVARTRHAVSELAAYRTSDGSPVGPVELPGLGSVGGLSERPEGGSQAWFGYTDHTTPSSVYVYDGGTVRKWADPPGVVAVPRAQSRQVGYASHDGTTVRMFVISPTADPDRPRPTILYGYGGFNVPLAPGYAATILAWVEAGGVYAVANLRGGSEEGEEWHRAGMRERKQNVFDDFAAAADRLVSDGWTSYDALGISGGSNGGLLVGAAMTQHPEKCAAVACSAPLLDMVRYERFGLGQTWSDEYGSAAEPSELAWLLSYSPYHHVREGTPYPATLFTVFDADTRVDPLHARKMCAALQHATTSDAPILLRREKDVGHGARSVSRTVDLAADVLAFLAAHTGLRL